VTLTFDLCDLKWRDFAKLWLLKLIIIVVVVVIFISGLLNNINSKENNSKPEKGHSKKTIFVETCTLHNAQAEKTIGKCFEKSAYVAAPSYVKTRRFLSDQNTMMKSNFKQSVMTSFK